MTSAPRTSGRSSSGASVSGGSPSPPPAVVAPLALPDPPLTDPVTGIVLRPWTTTLADAVVLAEAWDDPRIAAACGVPEVRSVEAAAAWIAGDRRRRAAGRSLELVIARTAEGGALGEVGLCNVQPGHRAELSWWVAASARGQGLATAAVRLLVGWALSPHGGLDQVWARIGPGNSASAQVAAAAGLRRLGTSADLEVWAITRSDPSAS